MFEFQYFFQVAQVNYVNIKNKRKIEVTKKAKLAILAGFETGKKNEREVPKD